LREHRTALISRAVTKGLPEAEAKAAGVEVVSRFKDSGVEWLGEVPEHWETPPLYLRYEIELGKMLNESRITGSFLVPYLRNVDVQWDSINLEDLPEMDIQPHEYPRFTLKPGDLLVCEGGEVGRAAIFNDTRVIAFQKALHRLRPTRDSEHSRFMYYTLVWASSAGVFLAEGNPNTIPHLTGEKLRLYRFPTPPLLEQRAIADYLDRETKRIDHIIARVEAALEKLAEYRTALITAAVTGKIDVRGETR
jgi:type I restriction enzyme, S subunit